MYSSYKHFFSIIARFSKLQHFHDFLHTNFFNIPMHQDDTTSALELAIQQQQEQQPRVLISSNSNVHLSDSKLCRTPSVVLNPALHSAAGHVSEIGGKHTGSHSSVRDKDIPQQQSVSGSENDRCNSQACMKAAPARQQKSKKKPISKDHVSHVIENSYHFNEIHHS